MWQMNAEQISFSAFSKKANGERQRMNPNQMYSTIRTRNNDIIDETAGDQSYV